MIRTQPADAAAHELRGLILFAMEDYAQAAATIHSVLAIGPGWDWTTLSSLYPDMSLYTTQLQALENYVSVHPRQADARFLLAYHYMTQGHTDAAAAQLETVVGLKPNDKLAADLLRMVGGGNGAAPCRRRPWRRNHQPGRICRPVDPAALTGDWHANRDDGADFELDLCPTRRLTGSLPSSNRRKRFRARTPSTTRFWSCRARPAAAWSPRSKAMTPTTLPSSRWASALTILA